MGKPNPDIIKREVGFPTELDKRLEEYAASIYEPRSVIIRRALVELLDRAGAK